jgi:hypothetical protein
MVDRRLVITELVVKGPEREANQRRRGTHPLQDGFTAVDRLLYFESVPAAVVVAEDVVRGQVEFEDLPGFVPRARREHLDHEIGEDPEEEDHEDRNVRHDQHRGDNDESESVLPLFF